MTFHEPNHLSANSLWALEPAVTPMPASRLWAVGLLVSSILIVLSLGEVPAPAEEDWHGNVSASNYVPR